MVLVEQIIVAIGDAQWDLMRRPSMDTGRRLADELIASGHKLHAWLDERLNRIDTQRRAHPLRSTTPRERSAA